MANSDTYSTFELDDRLLAARHFAQTLVDTLERHFEGKANEEADRILFLAYQMNAAAREADELYQSSTAD